ncbi:hypothetical protein BD779DRAFT_176259 [Infundibulicybe gibba]|nr:hypothetical protein BD779DRAFT_176259 [Infundibulicybe gibba]
MAPSQSSSRALIMDLPVDIIREIFLKCISGPCRLPLNPSAAVEPRLVLSHVCSSWRNIALNMPACGLTFVSSSFSPPPTRWSQP